MRNAILWLVLAAVLVVSNWAIVGKERILANGETMLLALAPRDPRSLLQGDYMMLRYSLAADIERELDARFSADGAVVVTLDENGVARLVRLDGNADTLGPEEHLLRYRKRGESLRIAGDAFFFEEGQQRVFADARFGEVVVDTDGEAVLIGLRDGQYNRLGTDIP